jgi:hypothetical protein
MRTDHITPQSRRWPLEPSPRRFLRCGVTRMVRSTAIPLLILAGMALTPTEVGAGSITYDIVNYPSLQNGYTVSGNITTDGSTGAIPQSAITHWDITVSKGTTVEFTLTPKSSSLVNYLPIEATTTTLTTGTGALVIRTAPFGSLINWESPPMTTPTYSGDLAGGLLWATVWPTTNSIAVVPEPSSAVLASIGAVVAFLAYGWSRHRRLRHRPPPHA